MKKEAPPSYHVYLLRCWQENGEGPPCWRFSLECIHERQRHGFADLEAMLAFLQQLTEPEE